MFSVVLILDILFKISDNSLPYRYFTKTSLNLLLIGYYSVNIDASIPKIKNRLTYLH